ncbi:MAG: YceI family protein [Gemmatimonadales bacterium]
MPECLVRPRSWLPLATALSLAAPRLAAGQAAPPDSVIYRLIPASRLDVKTGKAGLFGFAGHSHLIRAHAVAGRVAVYQGAVGTSHLELTVPSESLEVLTPPDTAEIRKVTEAMRTQTLRVDQFPQITFASKEVTPTKAGYHLVVALTLVGVTRDVPIDVVVKTTGDTLRATGTFSVKQTDFGIKPFRGGPGGTVKVADRVNFNFEAIGVRAERR